jgi:hypothetical protein
MDRRRRFLALIAAVATAATLVSCTRHAAPPRAADTLPSTLSDQEFWRLITTFSEPNGYFRSDNLLSNELAYQRVLGDLPTGGVYMGVGPEQNFTYIVAMKPKLSFIVDIRRGNLDEHLLYKAFIEMSSDRADFLSRLFARPRPPHLDATTPVDALFAAYEEATPSQQLFDENLQAAKDWLVKRHGFALTDEDFQGLEHVYSAFFEAGPELNYSFLGGFRGAAFFPTYAELMTQTDSHGDHRSYLATAENFRTLAAIEKRNALIPIVGNFAGPKAIRAVGAYLTQHGATVSAFYTSNVEMYLFQQDGNWQKFYANVATLPVGPTSTFIRSVSNRGFFRLPTVPRARSTTRLCPIPTLLDAFHRGRIEGYGDVIAMSK